RAPGPGLVIPPRPLRALAARRRAGPGRRVRLRPALARPPGPPLLARAVGGRIFSPGLAGTLVATVAISMVLTPAAFILLERVILPHVTERDAERPQDDIIDTNTPVAIAGYGPFGTL